MRISDWSSDVCSSDLPDRCAHPRRDPLGRVRTGRADPPGGPRRPARRLAPARPRCAAHADRKSVVEGKSVSVRVDLGGRRIIKKNKKVKYTKQTKINSHSYHL